MRILKEDQSISQIQELPEQIAFCPHTSNRKSITHFQQTVNTPSTVAQSLQHRGYFFALCHWAGEGYSWGQNRNNSVTNIA